MSVEVLSVNQQPFSTTVWNVTQPFRDIYVGRVSRGERIFGADATMLQVVGEDGNFLHELELKLPPGIVQLEDFRGHPLGQDGEAQSLALVTVVTQPEDVENGLVGWHAGAVMLEKGPDGKVEVTHFWPFPELVGKNATPVRAERMPSGSILVDFDVRLDSNLHALSRYSTILHEDGMVDIRHIQDNAFPHRWWNEAIAGTGGGFIPFGVTGEDGEPLYEVGLVHGQRVVKADGMDKRKYYLGIAIRNRSGGFVYLSEDPDISPEDVDGNDLRNDVIALYSAHRGKVVMDSENNLELVALVSRGDTQTHWCKVPLPKKAQTILLGQTTSATIRS